MINNSLVVRLIRLEPEQLDQLALVGAILHHPKLDTPAELLPKLDVRVIVTILVIHFLGGELPQHLQSFSDQFLSHHLEDLLEKHTRHITKWNYFL